MQQMHSNSRHQHVVSKIAAGVVIHSCHSESVLQLTVS